MAKASLLAALLCALLFPQYAPAQGWRELPGGKWWKNPQVVAQLQLTPDQQARIEEVWVQHRRELIDRKAELDKRQLELSELLSRATVEEGPALDLFDKLQQARLAIERTTFTMRIRIKNILTPEQQQRLVDLSSRFRHGPRR